MILVARVVECFTGLMIFVGHLIEIFAHVEISFERRTALFSGLKGDLSWQELSMGCAKNGFRHTGISWRAR
jgi:hypothetical protein